MSPSCYCKELWLCNEMKNATVALRTVCTLAWDAADPALIPSRSINPRWQLAAARVGAVQPALPLVSNLYPPPFNSVLSLYNKGKMPKKN